MYDKPKYNKKETVIGMMVFLSILINEMEINLLTKYRLITKDITIPNPIE